MNLATRISLRLSLLAAARGISFSALAASSGIPYATLKSIVYGRTRNPGIVTIQKLCNGLGISVAAFFDDELFRVSPSADETA